MTSAGETDPRVERTRAKVIAAVAELVGSEGAGAVTHQRVAKQSGVGRSTLYRHWPTPGDLLYEALSEVHDTLFPERFVAPVDSWLRKALEHVAVEIAHPSAVQLIGTILARAETDVGAAALRRQLVERNVEAIAAGLADATDAGALDRALSASDVFALAVGPLFVRVALAREPVDPDLIEQIVRSILGPDRS